MLLQCKPPIELLKTGSFCVVLAGFKNKVDKVVVKLNSIHKHSLFI